MIRFGVAGCVVLACGLLVATASGGSAAAGSGAPTLKGGGSHGSVHAISCAAPGDCAAGGPYDHQRQAFVISERHGRWGKPMEVKGVASHGYYKSTSLDSISCPAVGECAASGHYMDSQSNPHIFVVEQKHGRWGKAINIRGAWCTLCVPVNSISCAAAGNCAVGGTYDAGREYGRPFVASETNGRWSKAMPVAGLPTQRLWPEVDSVSCVAVGECAASGTYDDPNDNSNSSTHLFVVSETKGSWGKAIVVPGAATKDGHGGVGDSVSCAAAGECTVGGVDGHGAFVVDETNGSWGDAINLGAEAGIWSVSCAAVGDCAVGGAYTDHRGRTHPSVFRETNGTWAGPIEVPHTAGHFAALETIACPVVGDCAAGGYYSDHRGRWHAFVVSETNGRWSNAIKLPGTVSPPGGYSNVSVVSCAAVGDCAAGGEYSVHGGQRVFFISEKKGHWGKVIKVRRFP